MATRSATGAGTTRFGAVSRVAAMIGSLLAVPVFVLPVAAAEDGRLVQAAKNRDLSGVRTLLEQRADPNSRQPDGATALHWAAQWDDLDIADLLVRAGADTNATNDYGVTPLSLAATNGSVLMIRKLLEARARADAPLPTGETPLMIAARTGRAEAVAALVAHGAPVNAAGTAKRQTPLMWAAAAGHAEVVRALLAAGADVQARSAAGYTPLLFAAKNGDRDVTGILLDAGARVNDAAQDGTTPLLLSTLRGHTDYARFLIERGADPDPMGAGYSPLHWAAGEWDSEVTSGSAEDSEWGALGGLRGAEKLAFVEHLLARSANPNAEITRNPRRFGGGGSNLVGGTPFLLAAMAGDVPVMRALLDAGADALKATKQGTTPLMLAAGLGSIQGVDRVPSEHALAAVTLCLERGAEVRAVNALGETALHGAVYRGSNAIVQLLVERGADVNAEDKAGRTPLSLAEGVYRAGAYIILPETAALLKRLGAK